MGKTDLTPSTYLKYLPAIYSENTFWGRFLRLFEDVLTPIEEKFDQIEHLLDYRYAPKDFFNWMASWLDLDVNGRGPIERQRGLLQDLVDLYGWRGTRRGLREHIQLITGLTPHISEGRAGIGLSQDTILGENTILSSSAEGSRFSVVISVPDPKKVDRGAIKQIIEAHCPAHATYSLEIVTQK